jgi:hypothetical protein
VSDETIGYPGAPPGWYADPAGGPGQRWWDGYAWTEAVVVPAQPPAPPSPPSPPGPPAWGTPPGYASQTGYPLAGASPGGTVPSLVQEEVGISRQAQVAIAVPAIYYLVVLINQAINSSQYRDLGHQFHLIYIASQNGQPAPQITTPDFGPFIAVVDVVALGTITAIVIACIWQFRAAKAARALGLPATHSAGWGVGSWFVPIVDLWMPYQAIRDCLAADDPNRALVLRWWLLLVATRYGSLALGFSALFSSSIAFGLAIPVAIVAVWLLATAPRVVVAVTSAHRAAAQLS